MVCGTSGSCVGCWTNGGSRRRYRHHIQQVSTATLPPLPCLPTRCSCKCPEAAFVDPDIKTDWAKRKVYINSTVAAADCDCEHVVVPVLGLDQEQVLVVLRVLVVVMVVEMIPIII